MPRAAAWILASLAACALHAEVFWKRPADLPQTWTRAYHAPVDLDGGTGELTLHISGDRLEGVEAHLRQKHGDALAWAPGKVMAWGMVIEDRTLYRYLVQPRPESLGGYWITTLAMPLREAPPPGVPPTSHQLTDLPALPNSRPTFHSLDKGNRTAVEISVTAAAPDAALDQLSSMIEAEGWQPSPANVGGFRMFVRRNRVAFVGAQRGKDGQTRILRLHKPLGLR